jgi:branched-chain amino acid transport system permease protein
MHEFLTFTIIGITTGAAFAVAASGLVVTYATSGVFNIAHGAIGMVMAFLYWQLVVPWHVPMLLALALVVGVVAPAFGALVEVALIRRTRDNTLAVTLVVTIGLMVLLIGVADYIWAQKTALAPVFFQGKGFHLFGAFVSWQQAITAIVGVGIALTLRLLLYRTRIGIAMRAVVDSRDLVALNGGRPAWISTISWALGASLAALAGILIAPQLQLNVVNLTLLVIDAYAAAIFGRLKNLPGTYLGAIGLGLVGAYLVGYLPTSGFWAATPIQGLRLAYPVIALFVVLLVLPADAIAGARSGLRRAASRVPSFSRSVVGALAMVGVVYGIVTFLSSGDVIRLGLGVASGLVMLSLVPLTGWAGPVSLCQMTFAGIGAAAMYHFGRSGSVVGLFAALVFAGVVGVVVALPALRLRGLYLALATMAFATLMDNMVFPTSTLFTAAGAVTVHRPVLFGLHFVSNRSYVVFLAAVFGLLSVGLLALRRGPFGRVLAAMSDSEAACATLGLNLTLTKVAVFALSAGLAGLAGALFGGMQTTAGASDFQMLQSLPLLLLAVLYGITTTSGAFVGGLSLGLIYVVEAHVPSLSSLQYIATGLAGITLGMYPEGIVPGVAERLRSTWASLAISTATDLPRPQPAFSGRSAPAGAGASTAAFAPPGAAASDPPPPPAPPVQVADGASPPTPPSPLLSPALVGRTDPALPVQPSVRAAAPPAEPPLAPPIGPTVRPPFDAGVHRATPAGGEPLVAEPRLPAAAD